MLTLYGSHIYILQKKISSKLSNKLSDKLCPFETVNKLWFFLEQLVRDKYSHPVQLVRVKNKFIKNRLTHDYHWVCWHRTTYIHYWAACNRYLN